MNERHESRRAETRGHSEPRPDVGCMGNGCGDFGFIEDVSMLIALKLLVDDLDFELRPSNRAPKGSDAPLSPELHFTDLRGQIADRSGSEQAH